MDTRLEHKLVDLDLRRPIWDRFYTVAPLVVIGTREEDGYDLAPKHMAGPMGWLNYFGFVCTPRHRTYHNVRETGAFTVTFPTPDGVVLSSLTASPRSDGPRAPKRVLDDLPTMEASEIDGVFLDDGYLFLECRLDRIIDGLGENSLLIGGVVAAHIREDALRSSDVDEQQLLKRVPLLAYLHPNRYARIDEGLVFPFPADFRK